MASRGSVRTEKLANCGRHIGSNSFRSLQTFYRVLALALSEERPTQLKIRVRVFGIAVDYCAKVLFGFRRTAKCEQRYAQAIHRIPKLRVLAQRRLKCAYRLLCLSLPQVCGP